jgi:hypothetical protein
MTWKELACASGYSGISAGVIGRRWKQQFRALNAEDKISFVLAMRFNAKVSDPHALEAALTKMKRDGAEEWRQVGAIRLLELVYPFTKVKKARTARLSNPTTGSGGIKIE